MKKIICLTLLLQTFTTVAWGGQPLLQAPAQQNVKTLITNKIEKVATQPLNPHTSKSIQELPKKSYRQVITEINPESLPFLGNQVQREKTSALKQLQIDEGIAPKQATLAVALKFETKDDSEYIPIDNDIMIMVFKTIPGDLASREVIFAYNCHGTFKNDVLECGLPPLGYLDPSYDYDAGFYPQDNLVIRPTEFFYQLIRDDEVYAVRPKTLPANLQNCYASTHLTFNPETSECDSYFAGFGFNLN